MEFISTLGFDVTLINGDVLPKTTHPQPIIRDGILENEPPILPGTITIVNAVVYGYLRSHSERQDFAMFDQSHTVRNDLGLAIAQGGYIDSNGESHVF